MAEDSHYDKSEADFAVNFIENLCHTKGTWARKKFLLMDWQEQIIRDVFGTITLIEKLNATKKLVNRKICCNNFCRRRYFM